MIIAGLFSGLKELQRNYFCASLVMCILVR